MQFHSALISASHAEELLSHSPTGRILEDAGQFNWMLSYLTDWDPVPLEEELLIGESHSQHSYDPLAISDRLCVLEEKVEAIYQMFLSWSQSYYWTPEWQEREQRADKQLEQGEYQTFESLEALLDELKG